jgi:hypothetical protein
MNPFNIKRQIDTAFELAKHYGFELREEGGYGYEYGRIFMYAAPENEVFAKEMVLNYFNSWDEVMTFFQGYEKADMAHRMGRVKK